MLKQYLIGFIAMFLVSCSVVEASLSPEEERLEPSHISEAPGFPEIANRTYSEQTILLQLDDYGLAPELTNEVWLNTDQPLRLSELRGKVVLLDMWTFG